MTNTNGNDTTALWQGFWRLADPKISLTSVAAMYLGIAVAAAEGQLHWGWLALTALAFFCMEVAKNAWGDVIDYDSGTDQMVAPEDRTDFSGGKRVLVDKLLTRGQTWIIAAVFAGMGLLIGLAIVIWREPLALWIGLLGLLMGWSYHGPPLKLAYHGLGEIDVVLVYGPVIALSTYLIQAHVLSWEVFWLSIPLGVFIAAFLWVNEFPDYEADRRAGKRNLVVRLGRRRASRVLVLIYIVGFAMTALLPLLGLSQGAWLGLFAVMPAVFASWFVWRDPTRFYRQQPAQPLALITFLVYSAAAGTGVLLH